MTRITGRGAWNAANARLANKPFDDLFTAYPPGSIKILYCEDCKTYTNHQSTKSGEMICWCARVEPVKPDWQAQAEAEHADWLDEQNTRESVRPQ